jgi:hypothetical protein
MAPSDYKTGGKCASGQTIVQILGQSGRTCVYITDDKKVRWEFGEPTEPLPPAFVPAVSLFDSLLAEIPRRVPAYHQATTLEQLGKALFSVFEGGPEHLTAFDRVKAFIESKSIQVARFTYIVSCLACAAACALVCVPILLRPDNPIIRLAAIGSLGGAIGSLISVLQRSTELNIDPLAGRTYLQLEGSGRALLGALFGMFLICACDADLILGMAKANHRAMFCFAIVAGFSERLVPELLRKFESSEVKPTP